MDNIMPLGGVATDLKEGQGKLEHSRRLTRVRAETPPPQAQYNAPPAAPVHSAPQLGNDWVHAAIDETNEWIDGLFASNQPAPGTGYIN